MFIDSVPLLMSVATSCMRELSHASRSEIGGNLMLYSGALMLALLENTSFFLQVAITCDDCRHALMFERSIGSILVSVEC